MFKGDIAKFSPADLLTFLTHLRKEGVLAVTREQEALSISFKDGHLVDANSELADGKVLRALYMSKLIDKDQFNYINRAKKETDLPLRQILENIESFPMSNVGKILEEGIKEVMFQLFLWETGQFQFSEVAVDQYVERDSHDCQSLTLDVARQVDEYREIIRSISSVDRVAVLTSSGRGAASASLPVRFVLGQAGTEKAVRQIVATAPFTSYETMKAVQTSIDEGWIELRQNGDESAPTGDVPGRDQLFFSYKRSLKKIILSKETRPKVTEVVNFCKDHFDYILFIASRQNNVVRCMRFSRNPNGHLEKTDIRDIGARIDRDQTFHWVCESRHPFWGKVFASSLLEGMGEHPPNGECAIIFLGNIDNHYFFIYVASAQEVEATGPFHYLELLSWHLNPPIEDARRKSYPQTASDGGEPQTQAPRTDDEPARGDGMTRMVEAIKELPPMPNVVTRILQLLSDRDSKMSDITEVLSHDQALVARMIKVSNSALYGRGAKTSTLSQAVVRLGTRTLRSLVLTASTRSLFPMDQTNTGIWGQSLWQHSAECGLASRRVAELVRYHDPEEAFVGGVLHDIGKVVILLNLPEEYRLIRKKQTSTKTSSTGAEQAVLGFDHTQVGELLLERWQMPQSLIACVRNHHYPHESGEFDILAFIIGCGDYLSHKHGSQPDEIQAEESIDIHHTLKHLNLSEEQMSELHEEIIELFKHCDILD